MAQLHHRLYWNRVLGNDSLENINSSAERILQANGECALFLQGSKAEFKSTSNRRKVDSGFKNLHVSGHIRLSSRLGSFSIPADIVSKLHKKPLKIWPHSKIFPQRMLSSWVLHRRHIHRGNTARQVL